ncbi:MAG: hypothetical protein FJ295_12185 [Planctomycetes bacterium]|nr:hypothetical protein [Planctomycetota bacterium]
MMSVEINKSFRLAPFHNGGFLEPFLGARYIRYVDFTELGSYARFDDEGVLIDIENLDDARVEDISLTTTETINNMFGGQLGLRYFRQRNLWRTSAELRVFALQNFADFSRQVDSMLTLFDQAGAQGGGGGGGGGGQQTEAPSVNQYSRTTTYDHGAEFVFGIEARAEAAYQITRDIALNFGFSFMDIGKGVLRGQDFTQKGEDVVMAGINFGVTVNR